MDKNEKYYNLYVFISTFARNLIEVFIGSILYRNGYSIKEILLFYLLVNMFSLLITYPISKLTKKHGNRIISFFGILFFIIFQILLNYISNNLLYIIMISLFYALYRRCYWIPRRLYNLNIIHKNNIAKDYALISIASLIGIVSATYIGAVLLDLTNTMILNIICFIIFILSLLFLKKINFKEEKNNTKLELFNTIKQLPFSNIMLFGTYELLTVVKFLVTLYIFIYIKDNYQTIGLLNVITNLATILFMYLYARLINKRRNYVKISILLLVIIYLIKINVGVEILFLVSFLEGIITKANELSVCKEFYLISRKYEYNNYNLTYEFIQNLFRTLVVLIMYLFIPDLKLMICFGLLIMTLGMFFNFKVPNIKDYK